MRRTVKLRLTPPPRRRITTPSNGWSRSRVPSTTLTCRRTVSPERISGIPLRNWAFSTALKTACPAGFVIACLSAMLLYTPVRVVACDAAHPPACADQGESSSPRHEKLLCCVEPLHQARFAASGIISMDDAFFGCAVQFADGLAPRFFRILVSGANGIASLCNLRANKRFDAAIMQAALLFLAHTLFSSGIIGHVSNKPPRNIWPFSRMGCIQKTPSARTPRNSRVAPLPYRTDELAGEWRTE